MKIAYKIFKSEIKDLLIFYNSTLTAYEQLKKINKIPLEIEKNEDNVVFPFDVKRLEYNLRELILVKLISILEQYLTDNVKFIFTESKIPFKTKNTITFQHQELLSLKSLTEVHSKLISKDCRQLSSGGLDKIIKYYNSKFKLNLNSFFPSKERIIEYHDRRHLHVHNLGKTDKQYRKKYHTKKLGLSITDEYIRNAIKDIIAFGEIVNKNTINYLDNLIVEKEQKSNARNIWFSFQNLSEHLELIENDYGFWSDDDLVTFKDILLEKKQLSDNFVEIKIKGEQSKIKDYYKIFRKTTKNNPEIKFLTKLFDDYKVPVYPKKIKPYIPPTPKTIITEELIENVEKELPDEPWETGIHKKIAIKLNQSNKTISRVIKIILNNRNKSYS
ncbi:hypothetical protein [Tenacibaculum dicentrarchi]|uniref:hypothetical protein n=1 Tax=Tenacibaculum dicentrarchi TaxID=669041 RepID=UPI0035121DCA